MNRYIPLVLVIVLSATMAAAEDVTRQEAVSALEEAESDVVAVMELRNSTQRLNDSLGEARIALRQTTYAAYIRNGTTGSAASRAEDAMEGLDIDRYRYRDVLTHTREIDRLRATVFNLTDRMVATRLRIQDFREQGMDVSSAATMLAEAETAFQQEQYEEVGTRLEAVDRELDDIRSERSITDLLAASSTSFVRSHLRELVVVGLAILLVGGLFYRYYRRRTLRSRFEQLVQRRSVIREMLADTQSAYFVDKDVSKSVYEVRMDAYRDSLSETEEELAAVADRLGRDQPGSDGTD